MFIPHYTLSPDLTDLETRVEEKDRQNPNGRKDDYDHRGLRLLVNVRANGYTPQVFEIPMSDVRAGREHILDLEPAATVRGRVMIAPGVVLTSETIKRFPVKQKDMGSRPRSPIGWMNGSERAVVFLNRIVDGKFDIIGPRQFSGQIIIPIAPDGSFVTSNLRAAKALGDVNCHRSSAHFYPS